MRDNFQKVPLQASLHLLRTRLMLRLAFLSGLFPLLLAACADCSQDPSQAGFFCGVQNIASGTYERRQQALQLQAAQAETIASNQGETLQRLQRQEADVEAQHYRLQSSLASLRAQLTGEQRQLSHAALQRETDQQTLAELDKQLRDLEARRTALSRSGSVTPEEIAAIERDNQRLRAEIRDALRHARVVE
jgi:hypothetical protein